LKGEGGNKSRGFFFFSGTLKGSTSSTFSSFLGLASAFFFSYLGAYFFSYLGAYFFSYFLAAPYTGTDNY